MDGGTQQVRVTAGVFDGLEAVRRSGLTNMLDRPQVMALALRMGFIETAFWIEEFPRQYAEGIFRGFEVADSK